MEQQLESRLEELYSQSYENIYSVYNVFKEYFGEDKVDLQNIWDKDRFITYIKTEHLNNWLVRPILTSLEKWNEIKYKSLSDLEENDVNHIINSFFTCLNVHVFQKPFILVWWPQVKITNEHDRYVDINHLYAKVEIDFGGKLIGRFLLNRAEYTLLHLKSNYMHSHIRSIPKADFTEFQSPCTGSGPIVDTSCNLNRECDLDIWQLFCYELDKYVHVESLTGGPYHRLEELGANNMRSSNNQFELLTQIPYCIRYENSIPESKWDEFFRHFINQKALKFNYNKGSYSIGMSFVDFNLTISNIFIDWYNKEFNEKKIRTRAQELVDKYIIRECVITNNKIYYPSDIAQIIDYTDYEGQIMCKFKDADIRIHITDTTELEDTRNNLYILNPDISLYFLNKILKVLNYRYGRKTTETREGKLNSEIYYV